MNETDRWLAFLVLTGLACWLLVRSGALSPAERIAEARQDAWVSAVDLRLDALEQIVGGGPA